MISPRSKSRQDSDPRKQQIDAVNSASVTASLLHAGFVLLCLYVAVVCIATQDIDLARGKTIKLAGVDATVSLVGFYILAPLVVFAAHFNLLVHLRLLAVQVNALGEPLTGARDWRTRVQIFPFTNRLLARPGDPARTALLVLTTTTLQLLPILALLVVYVRFLGYQSQPVTWLHRAVIWADVAVSASFWLHALGGGKRLRELLLPPSPATWVTAAITFVACFTQSFLTLLVLVLTSIVLIAGRAVRGRQNRNASAQTASGLPTFVTAASSLVVMGTIAVTVDGEAIESIRLPDVGVDCRQDPLVTPRDAFGMVRIRLQLEQCKLLDGGGTLLRGLLSPFRHLNLFGAVLLSEPAKAADLALLKSNDADVSVGAAALVQPVDLSRRSLRRANLAKAIMPSANFQYADLEGADLSQSTAIAADFSWASLVQTKLRGTRALEARLNGADLSGADMNSTDLRDASLVAVNLQGANLSRTVFSGAVLRGTSWIGAKPYEVRLQAADLADIRADGVDFSTAHADAANFTGAHLAGAQFRGYQVRLAGANFTGADLRGTDFQAAHLYAAKLDSATLIGTSFRGAQLFASAPFREVDFVDLRQTSVDRPPQQYLDEMLATELPLTKAAYKAVDKVREVLVAENPYPHRPVVQGNCLVDERALALEISCENAFSGTELSSFALHLRPLLVSIACYQPNAAMGLVSNARATFESPRVGVAAEILTKVSDLKCTALAVLSDEQLKALSSAVDIERQALERAKSPNDPRHRIPMTKP